MFEPTRLPPPDEDGYFAHPDIPGVEESDDVLALCRDLGYAGRVVDFEYDAGEDLIDDYYEREDVTAMARWTPTPPAGDGWLLVAKFDTEGGPCAFFVRPLTDDDLNKEPA